MGREPGQLARDYRHRVEVGGAAKRADGGSVDLLITDMSLGGCRVQWEETLWIGERLLLEVPGFAPLHARVKWSFLGAAGLQFDDQEGFPAAG